MERSEYALALANRLPGPRGEDALELRHPTAEDRDALAELMLDAYRGTIDDDGETISEARTEVDRYLERNPLLGQSFVGLLGGEIVSACLASLPGDEPLIGYVMTAADHKSRGLASHLLDHCLESLEVAGHMTVTAWITDGNRPSERIFHRAGFRRRRD